VRRLIPLLFLFVLACASSQASPASEAREIEARVWSPYCPGRLLTDCATRQARQLRTDIRERLETGEEPEEVLAWVRSEFGDNALAAPDASVKGLVIWLVPAAIFAAGAVVVVRTVKKWRSAPAP
jgi:cytochrome c-type biogenesis protein CcmH